MLKLRSYYFLLFLIKYFQNWKVIGNLIKKLSQYNAVKKILFLPIFVAAIISILSLVPQDAHASVSIALQDQASCEAAPPAGTWIGTNDTCVITNLTLNSGDSLNVVSAIHLTLRGNTNNSGTIQTNCDGCFIYLYDTFNNFGTLINGGIDDTGGIFGGDIYNYGLLKNTGTIQNNWNLFVNSQPGTVINSGIFILSDVGNFQNYGTFKNTGSFTHKSICDCDANGSFTNVGTLYNFNMIVLDVPFANSGVISNSGTITLENEFSNNYNTIYNNGGTLNINTNDMTNSGDIENNGGGVIDIFSGAILTNNGMINNNHGKLINDSGGTLNNGSTGVIKNSSILNNSGKINNNGTINNFRNATILNHISGNIANNSKIINYCGGIVKNYGTISGNPIINKC